MWAAASSPTRWGSARHCRCWPPAQDPGKHLVVCPTSVIGNWRRGLARFAPGIPVIVHHGANRELPTPVPGPVAVLTSYSVLRFDAAGLLTEIVADGDRALVFTQYGGTGELLSAHLTAVLRRCRQHKCVVIPTSATLTDQSDLRPISK